MNAATFKEYLKNTYCESCQRLVNLSSRSILSLLVMVLSWRQHAQLESTFPAFFFFLFFFCTQGSQVVQLEPTGVPHWSPESPRGINLLLPIVVTFEMYSLSCLTVHSHFYFSTPLPVIPRITSPINYRNPSQSALGEQKELTGVNFHKATLD